MGKNKPRTRGRQQTGTPPHPLDAKIREAHEALKDLGAVLRSAGRIEDTAQRILDRKTDEALAQLDQLEQHRVDHIERLVSSARKSAEISQALASDVVTTMHGLLGAADKGPVEFLEMLAMSAAEIVMPMVLKALLNSGTPPELSIQRGIRLAQEGHISIDPSGEAILIHSLAGLKMLVDLELIKKGDIVLKPEEPQI